MLFRANIENFALSRTNRKFVSLAGAQLANS